MHLSCWLAACRVPIGRIRDLVDRSFLSAPLSLSLHHNAKLCQANTLRINIKIGTFSLYSHIQLKVSQTSQQFRLPGGLAVSGLEPHIHLESTGRSPSHTQYYKWHYSPAPLCTSWELRLLEHTISQLLPHIPVPWSHFGTTRSGSLIRQSPARLWITDAFALVSGGKGGGGQIASGTTGLERHPRAGAGPGQFTFLSSLLRTHLLGCCKVWARLW